MALAPFTKRTLVDECVLSKAAVSSGSAADRSAAAAIVREVSATQGAASAVSKKIATQLDNRILIFNNGNVLKECHQLQARLAEDNYT